MKNLYLFVPNENVDNYIKYGIKLSQNANKVVTYERTEKKVLFLIFPQWIQKNIMIITLHALK